MSTYLIKHVRTCGGIADHEALAQVRRTVEGYGGRWHSSWEEHGHTGERVTSVVLLEFGTMNDAQNWYNSSEYEGIAHHCVDDTIDLALVDDVSPDLTMAGLSQTRPLSPQLVDHRA